MVERGVIAEIADRRFHVTIHPGCESSLGT